MNSSTEVTIFKRFRIKRKTSRTKGHTQISIKIIDIVKMLIVMMSNLTFILEYCD